MHISEKVHPKVLKLCTQASLNEQWVIQEILKGGAVDETKIITHV
jgi:hypothetical protein